MSGRFQHRQELQRNSVVSQPVRETKEQSVTINLLAY